MAGRGSTAHDERQAQVAEKASELARDELRAVSMGTRWLKENLQEVAIQNSDLARRIRRFVGGARLRRYALLKSLDTARDIPLPDMALNPAVDLAQLETTIRSYAAELHKSATGDERKKLEIALAELSDRALLGGMIQTVQEEVERLKTIHFLEQCLGDTTTNTITKVGNDIADTVVTPKLRDRFQEEIVKLAAEKVRVEIARSGGKYGSQQYQVRLFANPDAKVQDIHSEGEKTCVALAAFLAELATAIDRSTLVFDDPVSSLDHRWRKQVAKRLVEEVEHRQIIVFTHDLVFVHDLHDMAYEKERAMRFFTVTPLSEADCDVFHAGFKKCCDVVDAHDPSIGRNAAPPPPKEILEDIQALKDWVSVLRDRQKRSHNVSPRAD